MRTAVDSSVLILLQRRQEGWQDWRRALTLAATEGMLLVCPVAFAEYSVGFRSVAIALEEFASVDLHYDGISPEAAFMAGQVFLQYRREGGPRNYLIPDFLIAAHATVQADRLAAIDRGYLRRYFPTLALLAPKSN